MEHQTDTSLKQIVEGLIFAADEPITPKQIRELIEGESVNGSAESSGLTPQRINLLVNELNDDYRRLDRPYRIRAIAGGFIFATNREVSTYVGKLHKEQSRRRLTQVALETLSIIAYKQPITKSDLETIRGVNSDYILKSLLEKDLIAIVGRQQTVGRPLLYGTTKRFLIHFGLNDINELPKPREIEELIGETELEVEKRLLELENRRREEEEEADSKRERKPHPLSEGAVAKIIPLKPDYRPLKKTTSAPEEKIQEPEETVPEPEEQHDQDAGRVEEMQIPEPEKAPIDESQETAGGKEPEPEEQPADALSVAEIPEPTFHEKVQPDPKAAEPQRGWKKWKNKIVTIIRKIFG
jgi:segregation and condensation protein B